MGYEASFEGHRSPYVFWASIEGCIGDLGVMVPLFKDQDKDFDFLYH